MGISLLDIPSFFEDIVRCGDRRFKLVVGWRESLREALQLFFLSIGISNSGGRRSRPDLAKVATGQGWQVENCVPAVVDHEGKWALRLDAQPGEGVVWLSDHDFLTGKIDLRLAAVEQEAGVLLRPLATLSADTADHISFSFTSPDENGIELCLRMKTTGQSHESRHHFPPRRRGEWIPMRVVVSREYTSVFVDRDHVPSLKAPHGQTGARPARIGIWRGPGHLALVADLRLIESDEWNLA